MTSENRAEDLALRIHHVMLPVASLDRSIDFYVRVLGMKLKDRHVNMARETEVALVGCGVDADPPFLELTQDTSGRSAAAEPLNSHIALDVNDLRTLCATLETQRVVFVRTLRARRDGRGFTAWIHDPDGHAIELVEHH